MYQWSNSISELFLRFWLRDSRSHEPLSHNEIAAIFLAGTFSGSSVSLVTNPISIVKIRQQIVAEESVHNCIREVYQAAGVKGFYRGYSTMLLLDATRGLYLAIYEVMKRIICKASDQWEKRQSEISAELTIQHDQSETVNAAAEETQQ